MKELSTNVYVARQIAAGEAAASRHQFIEKEHILIGICSMEKVVIQGLREGGLNPQTGEALQV